MNETRPRVLVVDDLPDSADSMADLLTCWGYDAQPHYGGVSAPESVRRSLAVVLDEALARSAARDGRAMGFHRRISPGSGWNFRVANPSAHGASTITADFSKWPDDSTRPLCR